MADTSSVKPPPSEGKLPGRASLPRRVVVQTLLWAGPLSLGLAILLLLGNAQFFRQGPGVPTAGDARAWGALWGAFALVGLGCSAGFVANLGWLALAVRRGHRPRPLEWIRTVANILLGAALALLWFRG